MRIASVYAKQISGIGKGRRNRFYYIKTAYMANNKVELKDILKDSALFARWKYGLKGEFQLWIMEMQPSVRFNRNFLAVAAIDFDTRTPKITSVTFNSSDEQMRFLKQDWLYSGAFDYEPMPRITGVIPDLTADFPETGTVQNQYALVQHASRKTTPEIPKEYTRTMRTRQYGRIFSLRRGHKPSLEEPTY